MQNKLHFKKTIFPLLLFFCFQLVGYKIHAQPRRAEISEMKDSINLLVDSIKSMEKENTPDKKMINDVRTRLMVLLIYNNKKVCGAWPSPSSKIELFEDYWKCLFDKALYGEKFILSYKEP